MPLLTRTRVRREMTVLAWVRRRIQQLGPYQSLALLMVPMGLVEPLKIVALFVAGKGHWFSGTAMIIGAYAVSLLIIERLFRVVKPKLDDVGLVCQPMELACCVTRQDSSDSPVAIGRKSLNSRSSIESAHPSFICNVLRCRTFLNSTGGNYEA